MGKLIFIHKKKLQGSTVIETLVALTILLTVLFISMIILSNVYSQNLYNKKVKGHLVSNEVINNALHNKNYENSTVNNHNAMLYIEKKVNDYNNNAWHINVKVFTSDSLLIIEKNRIIKK